LISRVRDLFDLDARPEIISRHLAKDPTLRPIIKSNRGLRVPGAFNGFELALRAVLGQQITVKAATTLTCRVAAAFGEPITTPFAELNRLSPHPTRLAKATVSDLARLGIISARAKTIIALAQAQPSSSLSLDSGAHHDPETVIQRLTELPGIGNWTAHYIAMRALRWPDAFPSGDIAVRKNLGNVTTRQAEALSQSWRPWRSYAVLHIWRSPTLTMSASDQTKPAALRPIQ
jgi:AraC family transcriptional regulator of adaptative response / DNA-3-methyladenine glycosylase II